MPTENTLRRRAERQGLRLIKYPATSPSYWEYGPYAIADASTNGLLAYGLQLADVAAELG